MEGGRGYVAIYPGCLGTYDVYSCIDKVYITKVTLYLAKDLNSGSACCQLLIPALPACTPSSNVTRQEPNDERIDNLQLWQKGDQIHLKSSSTEPHACFVRHQDHVSCYRRCVSSASRCHTVSPGPAESSAIPRPWQHSAPQALWLPSSPPSELSSQP